MEEILVDREVSIDHDQVVSFFGSAHQELHARTVVYSILEHLCEKSKVKYTGLESLGNKEGPFICIATLNRAANEFAQAARALIAASNAPRAAEAFHYSEQIPPVWQIMAYESVYGTGKLDLGKALKLYQADSFNTPPSARTLNASGAQRRRAH